MENPVHDQSQGGLSLLIKKRNRSGFETFVSLYLLSEADVYCTLKKKSQEFSYNELNHKITCRIGRWKIAQHGLN